MPNFVVARETALENVAETRRRRLDHERRMAPIRLIDAICAELEEMLLLGERLLPKFLWGDLHRLEQMVGLPHHALHGPAMRSKVVMERLWEQRARLVDVDGRVFPELPDEPGDFNSTGWWSWLN